MSRRVNLPRARRALDALDATLAANPGGTPPARTAAFLAGDLPADPVEKPMTEQQAVKIPLDLLERADALIPAIEARPDLRAYGRASRATVVRLALARGLDALAAECAGKKS